MSENADIPRRPADELRRIARYHRWVIAVVLAQLALWGGYAVLSLAGAGNFRGGMRFPLIITVLLGCVGGVYTFLLYWIARGPFTAVVMGLAAVVPCMGLLVLTVANGTATSELKKNGVKVGMFGAVIDDIEDGPGPYDADDAGW